MNSTIKKIVVFISLVLLQSLVLNNVNVSGLINPYVFPLFILMLPFDTKGWVLLFSAFFLGFTIDLFNGTMGMQTFATVFMAFLRPLFLQNFQPKSDKFTYPNLKENGFGWFLFYFLSLSFIHHITYFLIEIGSLNNFAHTISLSFLSTLVSVFIMFLLVFTFNSKR
ncbi:MAG: rod shape-determining protein MreD [Planctomycetota bacterium]